MLKHFLGEGHALLYEKPETEVDDVELSDIDRLLEQSPWLRAEVEAGRMSLTASGNTIRYNYAPSHFVHQAELLAQNAFGLPPGASEDLLKKVYPDYVPKETGSQINETWSSKMSDKRNAAITSALAGPRPRRNQIVASSPSPL